MRELKFRVWSYQDKSFQCPREHWASSCYEFYTPLQEILNDVVSGIQSKPDVFDIQQYTGLKDKNGREIYEGDILKYEFSDMLCAVKWSKEDNDCHPCFVMNDLSSQRGEVEIVGNIHENPSLLT